MKVGPIHIHCGELCIGDFDARGVLSGIQFGPYYQACLNGRVGDQINDDIVTHQRPTAPVLGNVAEHAMFDLVPFSSSRREMTDTNHYPEVHSPVEQGYFPQAAPTTVTALLEAFAGGRHDARVFIGKVDLVGWTHPRAGRRRCLPPGFLPLRVVFSSRAFLFASKSAFSRASRSAALASICVVVCRIAARRSSRRASSAGRLKPSASGS